MLSSSQVPIILVVLLFSYHLFPHNEAMKRKPLLLEEIIDELFVIRKIVGLMRLGPFALFAELVPNGDVLKIRIEVSSALPTQPKAPKAVVRRSVYAGLVTGNQTPLNPRRTVG